MSAALEILERFAQEQASTNDVMRVLASHPAYFVPAAFAPELGRELFDRLVAMSESGGPPAGELYAFTDESCLRLLADRQVGRYLGPVSGMELFCAAEKLPLAKLKVNPGGPVAHFWFIGGEALPLAALWARAMRLESVLAELPSPPTALNEGLLSALREFSAYTVLMHPTEDWVATENGVGGFKHSAMVFTAPDCSERAQASRPGLREVILGGGQLFEFLSKANMDGIVFNPMGPGPRVSFPASLALSAMKSP